MSTYTEGKAAQALVCDVGSYSTKIGYAGDDHPQVICGSTTAVERRRRGLGGGGSSNFSNGPRRDFLTRCCADGRDDDGDYELANPVDPVTGWLFSPPPPPSMSSNEGGSLAADCDDHDNGCTAWESHELVGHYLRHAFRDALGVEDSSGSCRHPLLMLDKPHSPAALRQRLVEVLFESHDLPAVFLLRDAVASCYAVGRTTGTVVDVGHSATMVTPVHEGFVEGRGVLRNVGCGAARVDERVLGMMDQIVKGPQGGRRRRDRLRRINQRRYERSMAATAGTSTYNSSSEKAAAVEVGGGGKDNSPSRPQASSSSGGVKRDAAGHFIREASNQPISAPVPDYLMPLYQVRRAPAYAARSGPFHDWCRMALAREIKETGLGVAVGPAGYVHSGAGRGGTSSAAAAAEGGGVVEGGGVGGVNPSSINPASANSAFLTSSRLPYVLPDGTPVEISTSSRCDVVELYFGNDDYDASYREDKLDEAVRALERYEVGIEEFLAEKDEDGGGEVGCGESSARMGNGGNGGNGDGEGIGGGSGSGGGEAGDPYSNVSYRGEKFSRHAGRIGGGGGGYGKSSARYPPNTISRKLYSACLPYIRTTPPNVNNGEGGDGGGGGGVGGSGGGAGFGAANAAGAGGVDAGHFHYLTSAPPAQMVCDAAFRCDRDQQASLLGNVVVCGGGSCITGAAGVGGSGGAAGGEGGAAGAAGVMASMLGDEHAFPDRLREEIEAIVHRHTPNWRVKVTSPNVSERAICSWLGGSILGSLGTFQDMWISRRDYEEFGPAIVNRKCP